MVHFETLEKLSHWWDTSVQDLSIHMTPNKKLYIKKGCITLEKHKQCRPKRRYPSNEMESCYIGKTHLPLCLHWKIKGRGQENKIAEQDISTQLRASSQWGAWSCRMWLHLAALRVCLTSLSEQNVWVAWEGGLEGMGELCSSNITGWPLGNCRHLLEGKGQRMWGHMETKGSK